MAGPVVRDRSSLNRLPRWLVPSLTAPPLVGLGVFFLWPVGTLVTRVVRPGSIADTLSLPGLGGVWWFTLWQAVCSTAATMIVGLVPTHLLARRRFVGRRILTALVTVPFMLPTVVVGAAFLALLPESWHGTGRAVVIAHVFFNIAVVVRLVGTLWAAIPDDLLEVAHTLGASHWRTFRHVTLPILRPALWSAASVVFLFTFTAFGTVRLLGGRRHTTVEVEVARRATQLGDIDGAAVLSIAQLLVLALVAWASIRLQRRTTTSLQGAVVVRAPRDRRERAWVRGAATTTGALMIAPLLVLVARSFRIGDHWSTVAWRTLGRAEYRPGVGLGVDPWASLTTSLGVALVATVVSVVVGTLAALAIGTARRGARWLDAALMLPLATSAVTVGLGVLITFDRAPFDWRGEWWLVPIAHSLIATPFVVRVLVSRLRAITPLQRDAAQVLGASPLRAWWSVEARRLATPIVGAAGLAAAISLGEFGASTFLTRTGRETLPLAIDRLLARAGDVPRAQAFALATILLVATGTVAAIADRRGALDARRT